MTGRVKSADPRVARERLEDEVTELEARLARAEALLSSLRRSGPEPRGFVHGLFVGLAIVVVAFAGFVVAVGSTLGKATG